MIETINMDQKNKCDLECNSQTLSSTNNIRNEKSESGVESLSGHKENAIDHQNIDYADSDTQDATRDGDLDPRIQVSTEFITISTTLIFKSAKKFLNCNNLYSFFADRTRETK